MHRVWLSWSSGKDSAWTAYMLRQRDDIELAGLLTTVDESVNRVAVHAVRRSLLERQAEALGLPLHIVTIPHPCPNAVYEARMKDTLDGARDSGVTAVAFGDLFLEDIRTYRQTLMQGTGLEPLFPLWGRSTPALAREMVDAGLKAVVTCVDPNKLSRSMVGKRFDSAFLEALPAGVDPCAENGEFHTFAYEGPMFRESIRVRVGDVVERDGFVFADVLEE